MEKQCKMFVLAALVAIMFTGMLWGQDRARDGAVRGTFVRLIEQEVGEQVNMGIVVKPPESDELVTVLVPRQREELWQAARGLQEGQLIGIAFATEEGHNWIRRIEADRRREQVEEGPEGRRRVTIRREIRRDPEYPGEERPLRRPLPHLEQMQGQIREIITGHLESMGKTLREVFAGHLERMEAESRELRAHVERMERELQELRAQNERLRRQLQERGGPVRERDIEIRERREFDQPREGREREERDVRRDSEERIEIELRREGRGREERDVRRDRDERREIEPRREEREIPRENREREEREIQRERDQRRDPNASQQ